MMEPELEAKSLDCKYCPLTICIIIAKQGEAMLLRSKGLKLELAQGKIEHDLLPV